MTTRLSVNINDETAAALKRMAAKHDTSITETLRRAVAVYTFIEDEVGDGGKTLKLIEKGDYSGEDRSDG